MTFALVVSQMDELQLVAARSAYTGDVREGEFALRDLLAADIRAGRLRRGSRGRCCRGIIHDVSSACW